MKVRAIVAAGLAALLGCSDSSGPTDNMGTVTSTFAGETFTVTAAAPAPGSNSGSNVNLAAGAVDVAAGHTVIGANKALGNGRGDFLLLSIGRATVGSSDVEADCNVDFDVCTGLLFFKNFEANGDLFDLACYLETGAIALTLVTASRAKGTFFGTGECVNGTDQVSVFTATNGTFDVALVAGVL